MRARQPQGDNPTGSSARATTGDQVTGDQVLRGAVRGASRWLAPLVLLNVLGALGTLAFPALLGRTVDRVVSRGTVGVDSSLIALTALVVLGAGTDVVCALVAGTGTATATGAMRRDLVRHVLAAGPALLQRAPEGDLVTRLVGSAATAARAVGVVAGLAAACIPPIGALVLLATIDPWLAVTFAVGMVVVSGAVRKYLRGARSATEGYLDAQAAVAARLVDALAGARTIAAAGTTRREVERVLVPVAGLREHGAAVWKAIARLVVQGEPVVLVTQVAVVAMAGVGVAAGRLSPGEMLAASRYAVLAAGIGGMLDELSTLARGRAAGDRIADVLAEPAVTYGRRRLPSGAGELELRGVTAGPGDQPVLRDLDLLLRGGETVALVGRSGAGKSLVAALAGRLCDPTAGEVRLDGVPLRDLDRTTLRAAVAYAFERPVLLGGTVAQAIGFGVDRPARQRVEHAARLARAAGFVSHLPGGYGAQLAETPLSGGEIQRLGLARALAHDARVLVLDDATSSLDTATEAEIAAALTARVHGRTRLVVTHRLGTAARADLVAWLDDGRIRAFGPHSELWSDPDYRAIFTPDEPAAEASWPELVGSA